MAKKRVKAVKKTVKVKYVKKAGAAAAVTAGTAIAATKNVDKANADNTPQIDATSENKDVENQDEIQSVGKAQEAELKEAQEAGEIEEAQKSKQDNFDDGKDERVQYILGHTKEDADKFESLSQTVHDVFDPEKSPRDVEKMGLFLATSHMVRLYDKWRLDGMDRDMCLSKSANFLSEFRNVDTVRKVIQELESKPIRDVYPLEVALKIKENNPRKLPLTKIKPMVELALNEQHPNGIVAGHPSLFHFDPKIRIKAFALLGGKQPGYMFYPGNDKGEYYIQIDTPGDYEISILSVTTSELGKMTREDRNSTLEKFSLHVYAMGPKE